MMTNKLPFPYRAAVKQPRHAMGEEPLLFIPQASVALIGHRSSPQPTGSSFIHSCKEVIKIVGGSLSGGEIAWHKARGYLFGYLFAILFTGCTTFHVRQTDESPDERIIITDIRGAAWFSSAQSISKITAITTDREQRFNANNVAQQGATNSVAALQAIARILELIRPTP